MKNWRSGLYLAVLLVVAAVVLYSLLKLIYALVVLAVVALLGWWVLIRLRRWRPRNPPLDRPPPRKY